MRRKLFAILTVLQVSVSALAANFVVGSMCFEIKDKNEHTAILALCWTEGHVIDVPETVEWQGQNFSIVEIAPLALRNAPSVTQLNIPRSCICIHTSALYYSPALERISVVEGNNAYCDINGVLYTKDQHTLCFYPQGRQDEMYHVPEGVTCIAGNAFFKCGKLQTLTFPKTLTQISQSACVGCHALTSVTIPESVTEISSYAFYDCLNLLSVKILGKEVVKLGEHVFSYSTYINGELLLRKDASSALTDKFRKSGFSNIIFY